MRSAIVFAVVAWLPAVAWANEAPLRATLEVDAANAGEGHDVIERRVEERGAVVLRDAGVLPAQSRNDPMIHVTISEVGTQDPGYRYRVAIAAEHGWSAEGTCQLCTEGELVQKVEATLAEAASHLPRHEAAPVPPPSAATKPTKSDRRSANLGKMGKAGIGLLVSGALVTSIGIGLAVAQPRVKDDTPLEKTTTRPPGYALVGIGAATLITGAILLSVDRTKVRRTAVAPTFGPGTAGVVWSGRF
jgi:hypothetical protein